MDPFHEYKLKISVLFIKCIVKNCLRKTSYEELGKRILVLFTECAFSDIYLHHTKYLF